MKLNYMYVTVRCYKPHKGYTDESHIKNQVDFTYRGGETEEENIAYFEKQYWDDYKPSPKCEVVGSISKVYEIEDIEDNPALDAEIESDLFPDG